MPRFDDQTTYNPETGELVPRVAALHIRASSLELEGLESELMDYQAASTDRPEIIARAVPEQYKRGEVTGFSRSSQKRMMLLASAWEVQHSLAISTVTYGRNFPDRRSGAEKHRRLLADAMRRDWPSTAALWRLEYQQRGAPHYHLLVDLPQRDLIAFRQWLAKTWGRIIGFPGRCQTDFARNSDAARFYLAKEVGKSCQSRSDDNGRWWGVINRKAMTLQSIVLHLASDLAVHVQEFLRTIVQERMVRSGRLVDRSGSLYTLKGAEFERDKLPSWCLLVDVRHTLSRLSTYLAERGVDWTPPPLEMA
jgi:hypothetical protein